MDETRFDALTRSLSTSAVGGRSRRGVLGLAAAALASAAGAALPFVGEAADNDGPEASRKKKGKKNKRCRKANQTCGGKKKCCKSLTCTNGTCEKKNAPECVNDGDCGANEVCQGGTCVPDNQPECVNDGDCGFNETCNGGTCACDLRVNGTCVRQCDSQSDCPGPASCRNHFPEDAPFIEDGVCVDEAFLLCDTASCQTSGDSGCANGEICVALSCGAIGEATFRCQDIAVGSDFEN
jgi:hypothetical protein